MVKVTGRVCEGAGLHFTMATELQLLPGYHDNDSSGGRGRGSGGGVGESGGIILAEKITRDMYVDLDQVKEVRSCLLSPADSLLQHCTCSHLLCVRVELLIT